jgi:hypothetical protein
MAAKVAGFGGFIGIVKEFQHPDWDEMSATMLEVGSDLAKERERAKTILARCAVPLIS